MAYSTNMKKAAYRHYIDGKKLSDQKSFDNAGYHFGFSAECATKFRLLEAGVREDEDAIWVHFPRLRTLAIAAISKRADAELFRILNRANFMQEWDTRMRYSENGEIDGERAEKWRVEADEILGLLI